MDAQPELDAFARKERLTLIRNWAFGLGLLACVSALVAITGGGIGNPKTWASAYHALATAGAMGWLAVPLLGLGVVFLATAVVAAVLARKR